MAVGVALSMVDSREDMVVMGLSKGAMEATAMVALQPMAPSKAMAGTPTMPGATLAETLLTGRRRLVAPSIKACGCFLLVLSARSACVSRVGMGLKAQGMQIYADVFQCHLYKHELPPGLFQWQQMPNQPVMAEKSTSHMREDCVMRPKMAFMILHAGACIKPAAAAAGALLYKL